MRRGCHAQGREPRSTGVTYVKMVWSTECCFLFGDIPVFASCRFKEASKIVLDVIVHFAKILVFFSTLDSKLCGIGAIR